MPIPPQKAKIEALRLGLKAIQRQVEKALAELDELQSIAYPRHLRWLCDGCGFEKFFTKPSTMEACDQCPRCQGEAWTAVAKSDAGRAG